MRKEISLVVLCVFCTPMGALAATDLNGTNSWSSTKGSDTEFRMNDARLVLDDPGGMDDIALSVSGTSGFETTQYGWTFRNVSFTSDIRAGFYVDSYQTGANFYFSDNSLLDVGSLTLNGTNFVFDTATIKMSAGEKIVSTSGALVFRVSSIELDLNSFLGSFNGEAVSDWMLFSASDSLWWDWNSMEIKAGANSFVKNEQDGYYSYQDGSGIWTVSLNGSNANLLFLSTVPEPASFSFLVSGFGLFSVFVRRKRS